MSRTYKDSPHNRRSRAKRRDIVVRSVPRRPANLRKLSRAVVQIAMEEAAAEKAAEAEIQRVDDHETKAADD
jgi:hypothetical protein